MIKTQTLRRIPAILSLGAIIAAAPVLSGCSSDDAQVILDLFAMDVSGGNGGQDGGSGGNAGSLSVQKFNGGNVQITNAGENAASFTPANIAAVSKNLGNNPLTIASSTTLAAIDPLAVAPANQRPAAGVPYTIVNGPAPLGVYISDGAVVPVDGTLPRVTGIEVDEGAVLTLELNQVGIGVFIDLANDFCNFGEVTTVDAGPTQRGGVNIQAGAYVGSGSINTQGTLDAQSGGIITVSASLPAINSGSFNSSGADTATALTAAGIGGNINFGSAFSAENTGVFDSSGGDATDGIGGSAGFISINAVDGDVLNGGALDASGGTGTIAGGFGGSVSLVAGSVGDLISNADITTAGGAATAGSGGPAGAVSFNGASGDLRQNATITTTGGSSSDPASDGGNGGSVGFGMFGRPFTVRGAFDTMPVGDIHLSGNIDTSGGAALATGTGDGGNGGSVGFTVDPGQLSSDPEQKSHIFVRGYSGLDSRGGDGNQGGVGGGVGVDIHPNFGPFTSVFYAAGTIDFNGVDVDARGGNVVAGATVFPAVGGPGGEFRLATPLQKGFNDNEIMTVRNTADTDLSGGTGTSNSTGGLPDASGGDVFIWGYDGANSTGDVASDGGADVAADGGVDGVGADGGRVDIASELGAAASTGGLSLNGGDGEFRGGHGGNVLIIGFGGASNGGDTSTNGGNADAALALSIGGDGGAIAIVTRPGANPSNTGATSFTGGTGTTPGTGGSLLLNDSCTGDGC